MDSRDRYYIGILASDDEEDGKRNIFINKEDYVQFRVKSLLLPQSDEGLIAGYKTSFEDENVINDDEYLSNEERIENLEKVLEDQLLIFCYRKNENGYATLTSGKATLVRKPEKFSPRTLFHALPVFCSKENPQLLDWAEEKSWKLFRNYSTKDEFIELLKSKQSVGSTYGYYAAAFTPSFVIWMEKDGTLYAIGHIIESSENTKGGMIFDCDKIIEVEITEFSDSWVYQESQNPTVMYLTEEAYGQIEDLIAKKMPVDNSHRYIEKKEGISEQNIEKEVESKDQHETVEVKERVDELVEIDTSQKNDKLIIDSMNYHSQKRGLFYNKKDLVNFHTAIKCSSLVILSGLSGTGKSAMVDVYARALGINSDPNESRLLFIPVRPSWNDDSDLLGYVDLVHMVYRASDSGFVDFLVKAQKEENKDKLFIVCFDEMNLARVEHYFSQFLSLLERPVNQRQLQLYDKQYSGRLYNSADYPAKINIGDNIKFVGTVNIDESTYHFSDKVLDRSNVIKLDVLNYSEEWEKIKYGSLPNINWSLDEYKSLIDNASDEGMLSVRSLLWDIHSLLNKASEKYGIGPRIVKSIDTYLLNLPKTKLDYFTYEDGIDLQIVQRVLTKVRGSETELGDILNENSENNMLKIFEKYKELSHFENCRSVVRQKQKELKSYGYCI